MDQNTIDFIKDILKNTDSPEVVNLSIDFIIANHGDHGIPIKIDGKRVYIPEKEYDTMSPIVRSGSAKIAMVKALRALTGCGLKEANDAVKDEDNWR